MQAKELYARSIYDSFPTTLGAVDQQHCEMLRKYEISNSPNVACLTHFPSPERKNVLNTILTKITKSTTALNGEIEIRLYVT